MRRRLGVKVPTIRYYEQIGLLPDAERATGNQRPYCHVTQDRLAFIRHARELGCSLEAIRDLLGLSDRPDKSCAEVDAIARTQLPTKDCCSAYCLALRSALTRRNLMRIRSAASQPATPMAWANLTSPDAGQSRTTATITKVDVTTQVSPRSASPPPTKVSR